jgi:lactate dehydrogenase-like 2-hydroxyacid dehydrogenase
VEVTASQLCTRRDQKAPAPGAGSVVDEAAVADALDENGLGGYAADVFAMEDWALPGRPPALVTSVNPDTSALSVCGSACRAWSEGLAACQPW